MLNFYTGKRQIDSFSVVCKAGMALKRGRFWLVMELVEAGRAIDSLNYMGYSYI